MFCSRPIAVFQHNFQNLPFGWHHLEKNGPAKLKGIYGQGNTRSYNGKVQTKKYTSKGIAFSREAYNNHKQRDYCVKLIRES